MTRPSPFSRFERDQVAEGIDRVLDDQRVRGASIEWVKITDAWTTIKFLGGAIVIAEVAIWNETGDSYLVGRGGAVEDEPFTTLDPE